MPESRRLLNCCYHDDDSEDSDDGGGNNKEDDDDDVNGLRNEDILGVSSYVVLGTYDHPTAADLLQRPWFMTVRPNHRR